MKMQNTKIMPSSMLIRDLNLEDIFDNLESDYEYGLKLVNSNLSNRKKRAIEKKNLRTQIAKDEKHYKGEIE